MVRFVKVRYSAQWTDGSPMYPGTWVETWVLICPTVWMLVGIEPEKES